VQYIMEVGQSNKLVPTTFHYDSSYDGTFYTFIQNVSNTANPSKVYSFSYGAYESTISTKKITSFNTEAIKPGLRGVTIVAASGDSGVAGYFVDYDGTSKCGYYASWPASSPYVTTVGGMNGNSLTGTPEIASSILTGSGEINILI